MAKIFLVFQNDNPMAVTRFRRYLSKEGWHRMSTGVYSNLVADSFDQQAFWEYARDNFAFDPKTNFFALLPTEEPFIPTKRYYNTPAPPWPAEHPFSEEADG